VRYPVSVWPASASASISAGYSRAAAQPNAYQSGSSTRDDHGQMMPAPAAVARPARAASTSTTSAPRAAAV
jgi:hypothetical protein